MVRETTPPPPPHHHTGDDYNSGSFRQPRQPRKLTFGMQLYSNPTRRYMEDDLNILKMEDDLNYFEKGRRPRLKKKGK
jgi:hypothetical protein